ncbi:hypothetical protein BpHYR1_025275 [Brachionus plicatilis]|uniref:Uncharacterized protein n=1 Tax=Brachionus plicatilis TaxID=10195 RepID=A0A3M7Q749_BRAPC|nr:hypothetical protein BpHYR1_025275 [Brachionus plicatilis]
MVKYRGFTIFYVTKGSGKYFVALKDSNEHLWAQFSPLCANPIPPDSKKLKFDQKTIKKLYKFS